MAKKQQTKAQQIKITDIRIDGGTQVREKIDTDAVAEYAEAYTANVAMPPLEVVWDGKHYWLWDGFHRWHGISKTKKKTVLCNVRNGSVIDARWLALSANKTQCMLRRTNADKKNAVLTALKMKPEMTDNAIAEHCGVSQNFVSVTRRSLKSDVSGPAVRTDKNGRQINTSNIGKNTVNPSTDETSDDDENESDDKSETSPSVTTSDEFDDWRDTKAERDSEGSENEERQVDDTEETEPNEPAADDEPEPIAVDDWGIPIQPHAIAAFADVDKFTELVAVIRKAQKLFNELADSPGGKFLQLPAVSSYRRGKKGDNGEDTGRFVHEGLEDAYRQVKAAVPSHTVCPYEYAAVPHPEACNCCHGLNWTSALGDSIPPACIKRAREAFGVSSKEETTNV